MQNDQNNNIQTPTQNSEPNPALTTPTTTKTPKLSNLTKLQKLVFIAMLLIIVGLGGGLIYALKFQQTTDNKSTAANNQPIAIQNLNCDQAKTTLADVYGNPELTKTYNNLPISAINGDLLTVTDTNTRPLQFKLTTKTKIEKIDYTKGSPIVSGGTKGDLKVGMKLTTIVVNPLEEIEYATFTLQ